MHEISSNLKYLFVYFTMVLVILCQEASSSNLKNVFSTCHSLRNLQKERTITFVSNTFSAIQRGKVVRKLDKKRIRNMNVSIKSFSNFSRKLTLLATQKKVQHISQNRKIDDPNSQIYVKHFINLTNGLEILPLLKSQLRSNKSTNSFPLGEFSLIEDQKNSKDRIHREDSKNEDNHKHIRDLINIREISFIRIQSSRCESNDLDGILSDIDHNLLLHLALGVPCVVYDCGSRGTKWPDDEEGISRAIWSGLSWIKYALKRCWISSSLTSSSSPKKSDMTEENGHLDGTNHIIEEELSEEKKKKINSKGKEKIEGPVLVRGYDVSAMYSRRYEMLPKKLKKKLRYYRHFIKPEMKDIPLFAAYKSTTMDGEYDKYSEILRSDYVPYLSSEQSQNMSFDELQDVISVGNYLPDGFRLYNSKVYDTATGRYQKNDKTKE